jgi:hypothetical protein
MRPLQLQAAMPGQGACQIEQNAQAEGFDWSGLVSSGEMLGAVGRQRIVPGWAKRAYPFGRSRLRVAHFRHHPKRVPRLPFVRERLPLDSGDAAR